MAETRIEWADRTWNPITGCTKISEACQHCYAERMSKRLAGRCGYPKDDPFQVVKHDDVFAHPLKWRKPSRVFVCSMGDLFHKDVLDDWILAAFVSMGLTYQHTGKMREIEPGYEVAIHAPKHTFMILTKRPERMKNFIERLRSDETDKEWEVRVRHYAYTLSAMNGDILPGNAVFTFYEWLNDGMPGLWLGVTAENQQRADERIPILLQTPAAKRFVSVEPMLGQVDLTPYLGDLYFCNHHGRLCPEGVIYAADYKTVLCKYCKQPVQITTPLNLVICGGETGPGARPMHPDWVRSLRDQCQAAGTPFFLKSWGDWAPGTLFEPCPRGSCKIINLDGGELTPNSLLMRKVGKKAAGRLLDGREWNEWPEVEA